MFSRSSRDIVAVRQGYLKGSFLVQVDKKDGNAIFLSLPEKDIHTVKNEDVEEGFKNKILQIVEKLPRCVYNVCKAEYKLIIGEKRINSHN